jgi:D-galactarolactone isomerase
MTKAAISDAVPNSSGTAPPRQPVPASACDAHCHILDDRFPVPGKAPPANMSMAGYRQLQARIGTTRAVIVQAKYYGTDNACLLDAVSQLGDNGRGVAVVHPDVSDAELQSLHAGGVRGLRFSVWNPADTVTTIAMIEPLAARIASLGWHAQLHMSGDQIVDQAELIARLPCAVVIDHMGRLPPVRGTQHPAFDVIRGLLQTGRTWVKLSGAYLNTEMGPPNYPDATRVAQALVAAGQNRLVWGSDWPHVTETAKPDDANLLDLLTVWAGSVSVRNRVLIDNPVELYDFPAKAP